MGVSSINNEVCCVRVFGGGSQTFLFLNGLEVSRAVALGDNVELCPGLCSAKPDTVRALLRTDADIGVAMIFLRHVSSQLRVTADAPDALAKRAWNAMWDVGLLGALLRCDVICNFQCDNRVEDLSPSSRLEVTNYHLRGPFNSEPRGIDETEATWLERHYAAGRELLDDKSFETAVHCLSSYRWNPHPRVRLAVLWSGIEGLFGVDSELVFRISLYAARFLVPDDDDARRRVFHDVKGLYGERSKAVHGSNMSGDVGAVVDKSADLSEASAAPATSIVRP